MSIALSSGWPTRSVSMRRLSLLDEALGDALLHEQPRAGAADLALVEPDRIDDAFDGAVEIGILEDDEGRLAAELERQRLARAGGRLADQAADLGRAGEGDLVDAGMLDERRAGGAVAGDDVDDARRQAGLRGRARRTAARSAA